MRVRRLAGLWRDRERSSVDVKRVAQVHVGGLEARIQELTAMRDTLQELAEASRGDHGPECPILRDLEAGGAQAAARSGRRRRVDADQYHSLATM
jgi:MerR family copper efflux transcriptional regulator